ncbi:MAG TPA: helix-turn-helix domain-containing protein [Solirubrobacterales bacterium]
MLAQRLRARQEEIEDAILARVFGLSDEAEMDDPEYVDGIRASVSDGLEYGIEALERDSERPAPVPTSILSQARLAARKGVSLDKVLRRYFVGYTLLGDFVVEESELMRSSGRASIKRYLRIQAGIFDHLIGAIVEEYWRDAGSRTGSSEQRRVELVERLLDGEVLEARELGYGFEDWHLGLIIWGEGALETVQSLASKLDRRLLQIRRDDRTVWAWLGGREAIESEELALVATAEPFAGVSLVTGEPACGLAGWRTTYRQAKAALPIALRQERPVTRYGEVALVASLLQDDLLSSSLRETYLAPLDEERDGGAILRGTLRAYIDAGRQVSSAAALLGVNRHTVAKRLRIIEERIGRPLDGCTTEIDAALRIEDVGGQILPYRAVS